MIITQGRKKFNSLAEAKTNINPTGGRVAILGDSRVVTIRPQIVISFPGTIEQLHELGLKLGGYPNEYFLKNKKDCQESDASKELVFARTLAYMEWLWEHNHSTIIEDLSTSLKTVSKSEGLLQLAKQHQTISDFLLSYRLDIQRNGKDLRLTGMELMEETIDSEVARRIGTNLAKYLKETMPKELSIWVNDPYTPYFKGTWSDKASPEATYYLIKQHPDILKMHEDISHRIRSEFYLLSPLVVLMEVKEKSGLNRIRGEEEQINSGIAPDWEPENAGEILSKEQLRSLLTLYFAKMSPLKLIHEAMIFSSFSEHIMNEHQVNIDSNMKEHLDHIVKELGNLQELENIFSSHPFFRVQLLHEMFQQGILEGENEDDEDDERLFNFDDLNEEEIENDLIEEFDSHILHDIDLTWREKGILGYAYFVSGGDIELGTIIELSPQSKQTLKKSLTNLEGIGYLHHCPNCELLHMDLDFIDEDEYVFDIVPYAPYGDFLKSQSLSWEAKGIYLWIESNGSCSPEDLEEWSPDRLSTIKKAFNELENEGLLFSKSKVMELKQLFDGEIQVERTENKNSVTGWYNNVLKPTLVQQIQNQSPYVDILNARYPSQNNMSAIQIATIANDDEMVRILLKIEGILLEEQDHPLFLAFRMNSDKVIPVLLDSKLISDSELIVGTALNRIISEKGSTKLLALGLNCYVSESKQDMMDWLLMKAVLESSEDHAETLLKAGASPFAPVIEGENSTMEFVTEHNIKPFISLFKKYT